MDVINQKRIDTFLNVAVTELLTAQYLHELKNAFRYKTFATWAKVKGFPGASKWFEHQYGEETNHANSIRDFLADAGVYFTLTTVDAQQVEFEEYNDIFEQALLIETETTDKLNNILGVCGQEKQFLAQEFVNRLLYNQLSEEEEARTRYQISITAKDFILADHQIGDLS